MRTTAQWWAEVKESNEKMVEWLKKQYHGEVTAEARIRGLIIQYNITDDYIKALIERIANDEKRHAEWVKNLLNSRGITAEILSKEERYWNETLPAADGKSFEYACAVGHLAETMRLDRIKLLAEEPAYKDIAEVFNNILPDEMFHVAAFKAMSTPEAIEEARKYHTNGMNALGLIP